MPATQVLAHPAVAEEVRAVLSACQYARSGRDYAHEFVRKLAAATQSECAIWLNWPIAHDGIIAQTEQAPPLYRLVSLCERAPIVADDLEASFGIRSFAAAPVMFRSTRMGVLAVANRARAYTPAVLNLLAESGRAALAEYECRERAAALGLVAMPQRMAKLVHQLRQPLGNLEACICFLDLILPASETRVSELAAKMHRQIDIAGEIVDEAVQGYAPRNVPERSEDETSLLLANSAISMVT